MTGTATPYRSGQRAGRGGFAQLLRAEWTKFRTVRGWVIGMAVAARATALVSLLAASVTHSYENGRIGSPEVPVGPDGEAVTDTFYFVHQPLDGNGNITVRVTSLTGTSGSAPWAKAGIIIKANTQPGSRYAAIMVTPGHGVRMQYNFTHDRAGSPGAVSAASPRWLRLTRAGSRLTGYESADGTHWRVAGTVGLAELPPAVQAGIFVASLEYIQVQQSFGGGATEDDGGTQATAVFDYVSLHGQWPRRVWRGLDIGSCGAPAGTAGGQPPGPLGCSYPTSKSGGGFQEAGGTFTVAGSGDIAPYVPAPDPLGNSLKGALIGLVVVTAVGTLFITAEYRRGMIRTTFLASQRRGRVLAAKAIVIGSVTFAAGLAGTAVAVPTAERILRSNGWLPPVYPATALTDGTALRVVAGSAALLALAAVLALAVGAILRRSAGAVTAVIVLLILPGILAQNLPLSTALWLLRLTPAAAFAVQQAVPRYPQVSSACLPANGCYPLAPWTGLAVLCGYAVLALGLAIFLVHRRDA